MTESKQSIDKLLDALRERAKELNCLYAVEELLRRDNPDNETMCRALIAAIPPGWQYPEICRARIEIDGRSFQSADFVETPWKQEAPIVIGDRTIGLLQVYYTQQTPPADQGAFLKEETRLIHTIADRVSHHLTYQQMRRVAEGVEAARHELSAQTRAEWRVILELLRQTDRDLHLRVCHRMLTHLSLSGVVEAEELRQTLQPDESDLELRESDDPNRPRRVPVPPMALSEMSEELFAIAAKHRSDEEILSDLRRWIQEDKLSFLSMVVNRHVTLPIVADAIRRYHLLAPTTTVEYSPAKRGVEVALIRRFLSEQLAYINCAKQYIDLSDFYELLTHLVFSSESHGKLGGKSAGLYLASSILKLTPDPDGLLSRIKIPKTWHVTSDIVLHFMHYNDLDDIVEQKYKDIEQVRQEYPHIVQLFKQSPFPPDILKGLSMALDDFGDRPLIVRSSSLLEDRMGAAFSGKYKSLFLANQGEKQKRLSALTDAIAEVYASTFGPDPIEYRAERGLIDFGEEMGIIIQEVVGSRIGKYFLPAFAGVAFSRNEFRWSPRIERKDGLIRIVPGLGTRAVDRLSDDYPVLIAPGQPTIRVNPTIEEMLRYAPKKIDLINLESNTFETIPIIDLIRSHGDDIPAFDQILSLIDEAGMLRKPGLHLDARTGDFAVTFQGLVERSDFVRQVRTILRTLEEKLETPVDIEFACDGKDFYLLQCRAQSSPAAFSAAPIPKDIPADRLIFSANRYVSNGRVRDITHVVYVDPESYSRIAERTDLYAVGRAVGRLNERLPKRQFILIGPGRWGSRGDIKLGVDVTYSDINNTAALIEVARRTGDYVPEVSFGTHFFQDLVEAGIHYLPLYPDDPETVWNEAFFRSSPNLLAEFLPEYERLADTIHLIDVPKAAGGKILQLLMNADLDEAVAILAEPGDDRSSVPAVMGSETRTADYFSRWRMRMTEQIAASMDPQRFGVAALYVFGSSKNSTAGPGSDIDLLVHFRGNDAQREQLMTWLEGWSLSLDEGNYLQTGYRSGGLLDVHIVTDDDIARKTSYAVKINAVTDAARSLPLGTSVNRPG